VHLALFRSLPAEWKAWRPFHVVPVKELNAYVSLAIVGVFALGARAWPRFTPASRRVRFLGIAALVVASGIVFSIRPVPVEPHPPLRTLPLFAAQVVFGLSDASFRLPASSRLRRSVLRSIARLARGAQTPRGCSRRLCRSGST
jgi:hypothetical protein